MGKYVAFMISLSWFTPTQKGNPLPPPFSNVYKKAGIHSAWEYQSKPISWSSSKRCILFLWMKYWTSGSQQQFEVPVSTYLRCETLIIPCTQRDLGPYKHCHGLSHCHKLSIVEIIDIFFITCTRYGINSLKNKYNMITNMKQFPIINQSRQTTTPLTVCANQLYR